ncbi:adaptor protein MecA [uncultured Leuconostoc sp.]|uniref:adaptor protein MecA n=1 Tax=uncultured Leuconostoc sp. TaxID=173262 RepID=UPI0025DED632|nr:adaptor protein MecA [uncultured Leuconostoc sp.]
MEMERINDNTIRVMIENTDLKERGISVMELLGDHDKIESFFYNILSEVDVDHDFSDDDQVSFQILPNRNGLELFISRLDNDNQVGDVINNLMSYAENKSKKIDDVSDERRIELQQTDDSIVSSNGPESNKVATNSELVLKILDFESIIAISKINQIKNTLSDLYRYNNTFYLVLTFPIDKMTLETIKDQKSFAIEFASESAIKKDVLSEHGKIVMREDALAQIKIIFK